MIKTKQILKIKYDYTQIDLEELERKQIHERCINYIYPNLKRYRNRVKVALIPEQQQILEKYYKFLLAGGTRAKKPLAFFNIIRNMYSISKDISKPYSLWTKEDLENYFAELSTKYKASTVNSKKIIIKQFFKWFKNEDNPKIVSWYKSTIGKKRKLNPTDMLSCEEIKEIINACDNKREPALFMTIYEGALRISEVLGIKIKDLKETNVGYKIQVNGKTGKRTILLIDSMPFIKDWLNEHPIKNNINALLFLTLNNIKFGSKIYRAEVNRLLKKIVSRTNIKKKVWPHLLRHSRLTYLAQYCNFNEMDLKIFAGWEHDSEMPSVYLHYDEEHVQNKLLKHKGLISDEYLKKQKEQDKTLESKKCFICGKLNPTTNIYCSCGELLDEEGKDKQKIKNFNNLMDEFMKSKFADEFKDMFKEFLENKKKGGKND